ncbi:hypothetical protein GEMRC1_000262 [Eukaryota sp. GEM-RC1]
MLGVKGGHLGIVEYLCHVGADVTMTDNHGFDCGFTAVKESQGDVLAFLIKHEFVDINAQYLSRVSEDSGSLLRYEGDSGLVKGDSLLHFAIKLGDITMIRLLIDHKINLNLANRLQQTPVFYSIIYKNLKCLEILVRSGCSQTLQDSNGDFPLTLATKHSYLDAMDFLFTKPLPKHIVLSALQIATENNNEEAASVLFLSGLKRRISLLNKLLTFLLFM